MFRGNFPTKVDAQGRFKIPAAYRKILEERYGPELYVTSINGDFVLIYPMSEWEELEERLQTISNMRPEKQRFLRNTNYFGQVSSFDKQGRVLIQPHLREAAKIAGAVAVMGSLNHLQVWNQERFLQQLRDDPCTERDTSILADLGI